jgi:hypothetical protein
LKNSFFEVVVTLFGKLSDRIVSLGKIGHGLQVVYFKIVVVVVEIGHQATP